MPESLTPNVRAAAEGLLGVRVFCRAGAQGNGTGGSRGVLGCGAAGALGQLAPLGSRPLAASGSGPGPAAAGAGGSAGVRRWGCGCGVVAESWRWGLLPRGSGGGSWEGAALGYCTVVAWEGWDGESRCRSAWVWVVPECSWSSLLAAWRQPLACPGAAGTRQGPALVWSWREWSHGFAGGLGRGCSRGLGGSGQQGRPWEPVGRIGLPQEAVFVSMRTVTGSGRLGGVGSGLPESPGFGCNGSS